MTVSTIVSRISFTGNGITTNFSFPYYFLAASDLVVIRKKISDGSETVLTLNTDYTVTGSGAAAGGSITTIGLISPVSSAYKITIYRDPAQTQETDLVENDNLPAEPVEKVFDRLTMIAQRLSNWVSRTMKLSEGTPDGVFDPTLPVDIALYPRTVPVLNDTATGFSMASTWPTTTDLTNAEANAAAAAASAAAAAASALAAATAVASVMWKDVVFKTFADSPITLLAADRGKLYSIDASGGAVIVNLPQVSGLDLSSPFVLGVKKSDSSSNKVTMQGYNAGDGTNQIDGANTKAFDVANSGAAFVPDTDPSPDGWTSASFGDAVAGGGGGGALRWIEGASAPIMNVETDQETYRYEAGQAQDLFTNIKIPSTYVSGHQIKMKMLWLNEDGSGNVLMRAQATLIKPGTSVITATTNQRTTTNTAVTVSGATQEIPQAVILDLTDTSGKINSVAVVSGDLIKVRFYRDTDTATSDVRSLPYNAEVTFT